MATPSKSKSGSRAGSSPRRNNNPEGRNQYSGVTGTARGNPFAAAAVLGGAVAAGYFLWSKRSRIHETISDVANQVSQRFGGDDAAENLGGRASGQNAKADSKLKAGGDARSQVEIAQEALTLKEIGTPA